MKLNQLPENIVFKGGTIIDPYNEIKFDGDVWIKNGKIEAIGSVNAPPDSETVD